METRLSVQPISIILSDSPDLHHGLRSKSAESATALPKPFAVAPANWKESSARNQAAETLYASKVPQSSSWAADAARATRSYFSIVSRLASRKSSQVPLAFLRKTDKTFPERLTAGLLGNDIVMES